MEVGDETVDAVEFNTGIEEDVGVAAASSDLTVLCGDSFQCAAAGGAHGDDLVARSFGVMDELCRFLADGVPLAVHLVVGDLVFLHGAEGAQTDVQRHFCDVDALGADGVHQLRREVEARRGGGSTAKFFGIDGLILALVFQLLGDIGRQRHLAELVQLFVERFGVIIEGDKLIAVLQRLVHDGRQAAVAEADLGAGLHPLAGLCKALPLVALHLTQEQQLTDRAGGLLNAHDTGRQDFGVVDHQQVARLKVFGQIAEDAVLDAVILLVQNHQPGSVTGAGRLLCDQLFG